MRNVVGACVTLVVLLGAQVGYPARADTVLGRWCDQPIPSSNRYNGEMTITITNTGVVQLRVRYADGSSTGSDLEERGSQPRKSKPFSILPMKVLSGCFSRSSPSSTWLTALTARLSFQRVGAKTSRSSMKRT